MINNQYSLWLAQQSAKHTEREFGAFRAPSRRDRYMAATLGKTVVQQEISHDNS